MMASAVIRRVVLRNYRSIQACQVELGPLTFLVGPNGAGKSNFLDALRLVSEALNTSLDQALRERGGVARVRHRAPGKARTLGVRIELSVGSAPASYAFQIESLPNAGYRVSREECFIYSPRNGELEDWFRRVGDAVTSNEVPLPPPSKDRLYLVSAAGLLAFRTVYDSLTGMGFYSFNPDAIREPQPPDAGEFLARDGHNLPGVLHRLAESAPATKRLVEDYLAAVVPQLDRVFYKELGSWESLEFRQSADVHEGRRVAPVYFPAQSVSDGTLRALGVLTAIFQAGDGNGGPSLIGIEEPEMALHPAAAGVIREALIEASHDRQIVVTSHSPELLDDPGIPADAVRAVRVEGSATEIGPIDQAGRRAVYEHLFTAGELLRVDQLAPDLAAIASDEDLEIFDEVAP